MALTAILSAQSGGDDPAGQGGLRALYDIAGMTLLERQAEAAAAVGVGTVLVLVDHLPEALMAATDRIRATGVAVHNIRTCADVARFAGKDDRLLLVADGLFAPAFAWSTISSDIGPTLLSVQDTPATVALERLDAESRWGGLAILPAGSAQALADVPDEWDPQITLLRAVLQAGAGRIACEASLYERGDLAVIDDAGVADAVEQRFLARTDSSRPGLIAQRVFAPLARALARPLLRRSRSGQAMRCIEMLSPLAGAGAMVAGWDAAGLGLALVGPLAGVAADVVASFRPEARPWRAVTGVGQALQWALAAATGWLWSAGTLGERAPWLALGACLALVLLGGEWLARRGRSAPAWMPDAALAWMLLLLMLATVPMPMPLLAALPILLGLLIFSVDRQSPPSTDL